VYAEPVLIEASRLPIEWLRQPVAISEISQSRLAKGGQPNVGESLRLNSPIFVRQYGTGGLSSISSRGFGPRQTQLVWNGFVLNHPMLGQLDYNLIPNSFAGNLRVATGNSSAAYGSGAVAGSVLFDSPTVQNESTIYSSVGTWGRFVSGFQSGYRNQHFFVGLGLHGAQATNNYPYFNTIRQQNRRRVNNQFTQQHLQLNAGYTGKDLIYTTSFWVSDSEHHIPGPVTSSNPQAIQTDRFRYWSHQLRYQSDFGMFQSSALFSNYELDYIDPRSRIDSESTVHRNEFKLTYRTTVHPWLSGSVGSEAGFYEIKTNNYDQTRTRQRYSGWMALDLRPLSFLSIFPSIRLDSYNDFGNALTASIGVNTKLLSWLHARAQVSNNFNAPTLNDLYWAQGGNPNLVPETAKTAEAGLSIRLSNQLFRVSVASTAFYTEFDDGILWLPGSGGIWSPINVTTIRSQGVENELDATFHLGNLTLSAYTALVYTKTESPITISGSEESTFLQNPYVPKWSWKGMFSAQYRFAFATLSREFTGKRFTTNDHSSPLDPLSSFAVMNLQTGVDFNLNHLNGSISHTFHNITNRRFEVIAWYPMPPRYHTITISFTFKHH
jgi:iron complex outermembrane receptor protein